MDDGCSLPFIRISILAKREKKYPSFLFTLWLRGPLNAKISVPLTYKSSPSFRHVVCKSKVM